MRHQWQDYNSKKIIFHMRKGSAIMAVVHKDVFKSSTHCIMNFLVYGLKYLRGEIAVI